MSSVILGGTFSLLHAGHRRLLAAAEPFSTIHIGVTTDALAQRLGHTDCPPARLRLARLKACLRQLGILSRCRIFPITDRNGPATSMSDLQVIIVSPETSPVAHNINKIRAKRNRSLSALPSTLKSGLLRPLQVIVVPYAMAADGLPVSSTRIKAGDIDTEGRRLKPLRIAVGSDNPTKLAGVKAAFAKAFPRIHLAVHGFKVNSGVHEQPVGFPNSWKGACNRAAAAYKHAIVGQGSRHPPDYCVGLESGLIPFGPTRDASRPGAHRLLEPAGRHFDIQFCALSAAKTTSAGCSMGFPLPQKIEDAIFARPTKPGLRAIHSLLSPHPKSSMGEVISKLSGISSIGRKGGAIAYLSGGLLHRQQMVEQAVLCAFVERRSPI